MNARALLAAVPREILIDYYNSTVTPELRDFLTLDDAASWIDVPTFLSFAAPRIQQRAQKSPPALDMQQAPSPALPQIAPPSAVPNTAASAVSVHLPLPLLRSPEVLLVSKPATSPDKQTSDPLSAGMEEIAPLPVQAGRSTILRGIEKAYVLRSPLECWPVPRVPTAFVLDMRDSTSDFSNGKGNPLSMDAIVKKHDQDSWGGGQGGSNDPSKHTEVALLDGVKCKQSSRLCNGMFSCSRFDPKHLHEYARFEPDQETAVGIFAASRSQSELEGSTAASLCGIFYNLLMRLDCPMKTCDAAVVLHNLGEMSYEGKYIVAGCAGVPANDPTHRLVPVPRCVDETILKEIMAKDGVISAAGDELSLPCSFMVHPRSGKKARCPYLHVRDGQITQPELMQLSCPAKMTVYWPVDPNDRRALVLLQPNSAHTHPTFPSFKLSLVARAKILEAIQAMDKSTITAQKLRLAPSTKSITGSDALSDLHPALSQDRLVRDMIYKERKADFPFGTGVPGVVHRMNQDRETLPEDQLYVHEVLDDGIPIVVCVLRPLAEEAHAATTLGFDMTYKTLFGDFKVWHVVMFSKRYNRRLIVARIFCTHETQSAFERIWDALFRVIEKTTGRRLAMPAFDKYGSLRVFVGDAAPSQAQALAAVLARRHNPDVSGIQISDTLDILPYCFRSCWRHGEANVDKVLAACSGSTREATRAQLYKFFHMRTEEEVADFHAFCQNSPDTAVQNWYQNKIVHPWFLPSLVQFLSKIPLDVWETTRGDTNMVESSHAGTNAVIGTRLPLLIAIESMHKQDLSIAADMAREDATAIEKNKHNNVPNTMRRNISRHIRATAKVQEANALKRKVDDITDDIARHRSEARRLQEEKENLTADAKKKPKRARR